jgi:CubicO group peptidase (beta-lactamase class C family)
MHRFRQNQSQSDGSRSKLRIFCFLLAGALVLGAGWAALAADPPKPGPEELQKIIGDFEQYAEQARRQWEVPGLAIAIVQDGKVVFAKGFGVKQAGGTDPVDAQTVFQIGSTSKAFTAALVAMLADEKKVGWHDKVINHLPGFRMYDPWVTREFQVEDLMAQRSGLPGNVGDLQGLLGFPREHLLRSLAHFKPVTSFRSRYAYQNGMFVAAGVLVEQKTGKTWEENVAERVFKPLGMSSSSADLKGFKQAKNVAALHVKKEGRVTALPRDWPLHNWVYVNGPAGGINSNVVDMSKWLGLQLGKGKFNGRQLVSEAGQEWLQTPKTVIGAGRGGINYYCLGWLFSGKRPYPLIWHNGGTTGHKTMVAFVPQAGMGLVVLSNLITDLPEALAFQFYDLYFGNPAFDWSQKMLANAKETEQKAKFPLPPSPPAPPLPGERYAGAYTHPVYGKATVAADQDGLSLTLGPGKVRVPLRHFDRDNFLGYWPDMGDGSEFKATFRIGGDGRAHTLVLGWDGETEFARVLEKAP